MADVFLIEFPLAGGHRRPPFLQPGVLLQTFCVLLCSGRVLGGFLASSWHPTGKFPCVFRNGVLSDKTLADFQISFLQLGVLLQTFCVLLCSGRVRGGLWAAEKFLSMFLVSGFRAKNPPKSIPKPHFSRGQKRERKRT